MPYIKEEDKGMLSKYADLVANELRISSPGAKVYFLFVLLRRLYDLDKSANFAAHNEMYGVLECTRAELYRRFTSVYEDKKIKDNGDAV